jgi:hypothetical protein
VARAPPPRRVPPPRAPLPVAPPPYGSELQGREVYTGEMSEGMRPYAEVPGSHNHWRHELSIERYSEMPSVEVFRGHELDAK